MKKLPLIPIFFILIFSLAGLFSCELATNPTQMQGEAPYEVFPVQRDRLVALFGPSFIAESEPRLYTADFGAGSNPHHPILGGRRLAGVYDPSLDKIWIDWSTGTEEVVAHELTHRWQNRVLHDALPGSSDRMSLKYGFEDCDVEPAIDQGLRLNCEQEARLVSLYFDDNFQAEPRSLIYQKYARKLLRLPAE